MDILESDNPNLVGEYLREMFWKPKNKSDYGCYTLFDYSPGVKELPDNLGEDGNFWKRAELDDIICEWFWDGDGCLFFELPDGRCLLNDDCKKDYRWEWI